MSHHTAVKGKTTEALFLKEFLAYGFDVSVPFGGSTPYDLLIDIDGTMFKIQCKTARLRKGVVIFESSSKPKGSKKKVPYDKGDRKVDFLAVFCPSNEGRYLVKPDSRVVRRLRVSTDPVVGRPLDQASNHEFDKVLGKVIDKVKKKK